MERYLYIAKVNLKYQLWPHALAALLLCVISPLLMGVENLDSQQTAKIIDVYLCLLGIILLVPVFWGDDDHNIRDLCASKMEPMFFVHLIRLLESFILLVALLVGYLLFLKSRNCCFAFDAYLFGAVANCLFLGGLGVAIYGISDLMPVAYMIPILYYILCFGLGGKHLGKFYLFSLSYEGSKDKIYLLAGGILLTAIGLWARNWKVRILSTFGFGMK